MAYYQRHLSPHRDHDDPYYNNTNHTNSYRDRDRDHRRRSPYSPGPRGRSPPRDAPKGPRSFHQPPNEYRSRSGSHDRVSGGRGGGGGGGGGGRDGERGYYDRDAPRSRSPSRERERERERFGGPASRDVIIEGLGVDVDEDYVIMRGLKDKLQVEGVEKVAVIRDRKTGISRQFAFVHFCSVSAARAFLERNYPALTLGHGAEGCRIAFSRERENDDRRRGRREEEEEWKCRVCLLLNYPRRMECFRCQTPRSEVTLTGTLTHPTPTHFMNDGERDMASSPPSQFLLFRGLEPTVTEELLAKGALKLTVPPGTTPEPSKTGPIGATEASLKRVLLVRDRKTDESWRYGFVEFATATEAQAALAAYGKMEKFTISSKPVTASYIHPGVFVPVYNAPRGAERFTFLPMTANVGGGLRLAYWDDDGYVSEHIVAKVDDVPAASAGEAESKEKTKGAKGAKGGADDKSKNKKRKAEKETNNGAAAPAAATKKAVPAHLQFWQNRHSELHGIKNPDPASNGSSKPDADSGSTDGSEKGSTGSAAKKRKTEKQAEAPPQRESFADMNKLACLLCSRMFKTPEKVHEHERVSQLHLSNMKDPAIREAALKKLAKAGITTITTAAPSTAPGPEYRDRAKERRQVFGKSTAPGNATKKAPPKKEPSPEPEMPSKGAALLGKMGWTTGQGLGASGEGRTEHVVAEMYTQGVGLGMKGAKVGDVEEISKGGGVGGVSYNEFVKRTKEKAKERYQEMQ